MTKIWKLSQMRIRKERQMRMKKEIRVKIYETIAWRVSIDIKRNGAVSQWYSKCDRSSR